MPGTRHAKNNTALGYFTRHERSALGWGSKKTRIAKEAIKQFHACTLCLKLCEDPLICPRGDLFCKECIYQSLLSQKRKNKQKLKEYHEQQQLNHHNMQQQDRKDTVDKFLQFDKFNNDSQPQNNARTAPHTHTSQSDPKTLLTAPNPADKNLSCFWIPSLTPNAGPANLRPPDNSTYCPGCNQSLKLKQLVSCRFTMSVQDDSTVLKKVQNQKNEETNGKKTHKKKNKSEGIKEISDSMTMRDSGSEGSGLFECGSCSKPLTNAIRCVCLSKCGHVVCFECVKKFVSKNKACTVCDEPCKKKHIIMLSSGGTGFAAHDDQIEATKKAVAFQ